MLAVNEFCEIGEKQIKNSKIFITTLNKILLNRQHKDSKDKQICCNMSVDIKVTTKLTD